MVNINETLNSGLAILFGMISLHLLLVLWRRLFSKETTDKKKESLESSYYRAMPTPDTLKKSRTQYYSDTSMSNIRWITRGDSCPLVGSKPVGWGIKIQNVGNDTIGTYMSSKGDLLDAYYYEVYTIEELLQTWHRLSSNDKIGIIPDFDLHIPEMLALDKLILKQLINYLDDSGSYKRFHDIFKEKSFIYHENE